MKKIMIVKIIANICQVLYHISGSVLSIFGVGSRELGHPYRRVGWTSFAYPAVDPGAGLQVSTFIKQNEILYKLLFHEVSLSFSTDSGFLVS